jgi:DNA-directed RNA polymerase specialized sigma24 family protein
MVTNDATGEAGRRAPEAAGRQLRAEDVAAVFERHGARAYGLALHLLGDRALAETAVERAFGDLRAAAAEAEPPEIVLVARVRARARELGEDTGRRDAPTGPPMARAAGGAVARALARLPEEERAILELVCYGALSEGAAAARAGVPVAVARRRLATAMRSVRAALADERDTVAADGR